MSKILFISQQDLEELCNVSESVYYNDIDHLTQNIQLTYVRPFLGRSFYNELIDQVENSSLTANNTALITELIPWLAWLVYSEYVPSSNLQSTSSGYVKNVDENFQFPDKDELANVAKRARHMSDKYKDILIDFLRENKADYPLWKDDCDKDQIKAYSITKVGGKQNINRNRIINVYDSPRGNK